MTRTTTRRKKERTELNTTQHNRSDNVVESLFLWLQDSFLPSFVHSFIRFYFALLVSRYLLVMYLKTLLSFFLFWLKRQRQLYK